MAAVLCIIEIRANEFTINQRYWDRSLINSKVVLPTGHLCSTYTCIDMHVCESMCAPHLWKLKIDLTPKALALKSLCVSKWWINKKLSPVQRDYIINNCDVINWFCHRLAWIVIKWRRQLSLMISLLITMSVVRQKTKKKLCLKIVHFVAWNVIYMHTYKCEEGCACIVYPLAHILYVYRLRSTYALHPHTSRVVFWI